MTTDVRQAFRVERHGTIAVITPLAEVEKLYAHDIHMAAPLVLEPLKDSPPAGLLIDLSQVKFFPSSLMSFLLRCQMLTKRNGTRMALAGLSDQARDMLHLTSLDTLWPIYRTWGEALQALSGPGGAAPAAPQP